MRAKDPAEKAVRDIRRKTRKQYSAEEKIRIVLEGLRGEESIAALCRREGIAESLYYSWLKEFLEAGKKRLTGDTARQDVREHFLGPIMYVAAVDPLNAHWAPCLVYDGQQRLTTITLILKALSRHLKDDTVPDGFGPDQIRSEYLVNPFGKGDQHYRLVLKAGDAETLLALIHDRPLPAEPPLRIMDAIWTPPRGKGRFGVSGGEVAVLYSACLCRACACWP